MANILVIEDAEDLREQITEFLTFRGFQVTEAQNGQMGLEAALQHPPDIILSDVVMPVMDGYDLLKELRSHPKLADVPFVFITARTANTDLRYAMQLGADYYLTKPFKFNELERVLRMQLGKNKPAEAQSAQKTTELPASGSTARIDTQVLSKVNHGIKSLMTVNVSAVFLLREHGDELSPEQHERYLLQILRSSYQTIESLDNFKTYIRVSQSALDKQTEALQVCELMHSLIENLQDRQTSQHEIVLDCTDCAAVMIEADESLLRHALLNLLSNAIKYSPQDSRVTIMLTKDSSYLHIMVHDQGDGVPEDEQAHLFELFYRGSNAGHQPGTGLGLTVVQLIAHAHGGTVSVNSTPDQGTTFTLHLPL